jgi:hypothetical protein
VWISVTQATVCLHLITFHQSDVFRRSSGVVLVTKNVPSQKLGGGRIHYMNMELPAGFIWGDVGSEW